MKKLMFSAALMAASVLSLSAQEKGDFTVGGMIGVQGGSNTLTMSYQNQSQNEKTPGTTSLGFSPQFSYFVIDNLELSAGLEYNMNKEFSETYNDKNYFNTTHIAMFTIGANYYIPVIKDKLFYTPGVQFGFGGGSYKSPDIDYTTDNVAPLPPRFLSHSDSLPTSANLNSSRWITSAFHSISSISQCSTIRLKQELTR